MRRFPLLALLLLAGCMPRPSGTHPATPVLPVQAEPGDTTTFPCVGSDSVPPIKPCVRTIPNG